MTRKMKDSGIEWIGEIPNSTRIINTKFLLNYQKGKNPQETNSEQVGLPYIGAGDLEFSGSNHTYENYTNEQLPKVKKDETLILWDGARAGLIGIGHSGYIGSTVVKVTPKVDYIDNKFWYWYVKGFQPVLIDWVEGTTIPHMNRKFINDIGFINFSLKKQKNIANFLDEKTQEIGNIISKTKKAIEEYKKYKQSLITETVTKGLDKNAPMKDSEIEWVGEIPGHWEVTRLKRTLDIPITDGPHATPKLVSDGVPFISAEAIKNNRIDFNLKRGYITLEDHLEYIKKCKPQINDIFMIKSGATTGNIAIVETNQEFSIWSPLALIRANDEIINYGYLFHYLYSKKYQEQVRLFWNYGTQQNIGMGVIGNLYVSLPQLKEQKEIAEFLDIKTSEIDHIIETKEKLVKEMEAYKKSLIYETVTGKREVN